MPWLLIVIAVLCMTAVVIAFTVVRSIKAARRRERRREKRRMHDAEALQNWTELANRAQRR